MASADSKQEKLCQRFADSVSFRSNGVNASIKADAQAGPGEPRYASFSFCDVLQ